MWGNTACTLPDQKTKTGTGNIERGWRVSSEELRSGATPAPYPCGGTHREHRMGPDGTAGSDRETGDASEVTPLPAWRHGPVTLAADTRVMTRRGPGGAHWAETGPGAQSVVSESHRDGRGRHRDRSNQPGRVTSHLAGPRPALPRPRVSLVTRAVPGPGLPRTAPAVF